MKIAIMTDNFYPGTGGTETAVYNLAEALVGLGHDVLVCAPNYYKSKKKDNFVFDVARCKSIMGDPNNYLALHGISKKFQHQLEDFAPQVIHCHSNAAMLTCAVKYGKKHNVPVIVTLHTKFSMCYFEATHSRLITHMICRITGRNLKKCAKICSVSYSMKEEFAKYGYRGDFDVIKNGTPIFDETEDLRRLAREKYGITDFDNVLIFVGRVEKVKNVEFIFETLKELNKTFDNFKMFFAGKISDKKLVKKVKKCEFAEKIVFTGLITEKKMLQSLYQNAKLHLFPSIFDNDSMAIIEAASFGTPSVVLRGSGSAERITDGQNGFTVEENAQEYAQKIEYLLKNDVVLAHVAEHAKTELQKDWQTTAEEYVKIYEELLNTDKQ